MPKIAVEIEWDLPNEPHWLNADNVAIALHAYCVNTKFKVRGLETDTLTNQEAKIGEE